MVLAPIAALLLPFAVSAQKVPCNFGDDGFQLVDCCKTTSPKLPEFPTVSSRVAHGSYSACTLRCSDTLSVVYGNPNWINCDTAVQKCEIRTPTGYVAASGVLTMKYARTWQLVNTEGQIWRFLLNGYLDFQPLPYEPKCPTPAGRTLVTGFIDYVGYCDAADWSFVAALSTMPACVNPFSPGPIPLVSTQHHFVAPSTFTYAAGAVPTGLISNEDLRASTIGSWPYKVACHGEAEVVRGAVTNRFVNCLCSPSFKGDWVHQDLAGTVSCAGSYANFIASPNANANLPTGYASRYLGYWTSGSPHKELSLHYGYIDYNAPCATAEVKPRFMTGYSTTGSGRLFPPPLLPVIGAVEYEFTDLQTLRAVPSSVSNPTTYASDLVLNLNLR